MKNFVLSEIKLYVHIFLKAICNKNMVQTPKLYIKHDLNIT